MYLGQLTTNNDGTVTYGYPEVLERLTNSMRGFEEYDGVAEAAKRIKPYFSVF